MQAKGGLNNTQRKMLDEIYMKRFDEKTKPYKQKRDQERETLSKELLEEVTNSNKVNEYKQLIAKAQAIKDSLAKAGISIGTNYDGVVKVELAGWRNPHPKLQLS